MDHVYDNLRYLDAANHLIDILLGKLSLYFVKFRIYF